MLDQNDFGLGGERVRLDQLIRASQLYQDSASYKELLDFVGRLRNFSPFNAMLLQIQKPGLSYAASAHDWHVRFGRQPKTGARPLIILWPFGPVALVYDVMDTEGEPLPADVSAFGAQGPVTRESLSGLMARLEGEHVRCTAVDAGDYRAGSIQAVHYATHERDANRYEILINRNHTPPVQFATLAHELAHLCLGHVGADKRLNIKARETDDVNKMELEAESVAYIVCARAGVEPDSRRYLAGYVTAHTSIDDVDLYQVMTAAAKVLGLLGIKGERWAR